LADDETPAPTELLVLGRKLQVPRAANGAAMFTFAELCEKALGPADYGAIATFFHTVVLDCIPVLKPEARDTTRRFVTLIDEMYEHRVNLICAAAVPPEQLCTAGDHAREFQRTVSRLSEMQSDDYIASPHLT
jgi:cell division protein ZapE